MVEIVFTHSPSNHAVGLGLVEIRDGDGLLAADVAPEVGESWLQLVERFDGPRVSGSDGHRVFPKGAAILPNQLAVQQFVRAVCDQAAFQHLVVLVDR